MLTGTTLLEGEAPSLQEWTERGTQKSMPHLVLSNLAMGGIAGALRKNPDVKHLSIVDTGSGTGTTVAGSFLAFFRKLSMEMGKL